jgi:hypothetical protein
MAGIMRLLGLCASTQGQQAMCRWVIQFAYACLQILSSRVLGQHALRPAWTDMMSVLQENAVAGPLPEPLAGAHNVSFHVPDDSQVHANHLSEWGFMLKCVNVELSSKGAES